MDEATMSSFDDHPNLHNLEFVLTEATKASGMEYDVDEIINHGATNHPHFV